MIIAVPYADGEIFSHFGRTEQFKIYDIQDGVINKTEIVDTNCSGHEAVAALLAEMNVNVVICENLGEGAMDALNDSGITVITGAKGDPNAAVAAYVCGELTSEGVNCDHHEEEGEDCGCGCGGSCGSGGGCAGCGGGCGGPREPLYEGPNAGKKVSVHYTGTLDDGFKFDSSYDHGVALEFICAMGQMIPGFDKAVVNMAVGDEVDVHIPAAEAYGEINPNLIINAPIENIPNAGEFNVGDHVYLSNAMGQPIPARITAKDDVNITFDANHELAGQPLNFHIELLSVQE